MHKAVLIGLLSSILYSSIFFLPSAFAKKGNKEKEDNRNDLLHHHHRDYKNDNDSTTATTTTTTKITLDDTITKEKQQDKKPNNILLFLTDDQDVVLGSFDYMPNVRTLLQEQGMTFQNAFVHTPVCCPSRSSILTGRYLHNCGTINNSITGNCYGEPWKTQMEPYHTYAIHAQQAGYTTAYAGKYLNQYGYKNSTDIPPGWDYWLGLKGNSVYYNYTVITKNGKNKPTIVRRHGDDYTKDYLPDVMYNYSLSLLKTMPEPWLMVLAWPSCHAPFTPAPWANGTMRDYYPPMNKNYNATTSYMMQKHWLLRQLHPLSHDTAKQVNTFYQMRLETLKSVDEHVRDIITTLKEPRPPPPPATTNNGINDDDIDHDQMLDNTVIIYTSDNGFQFGQHRLALDKRHLYEHDIRVPFVIRGPHIPPNSTSLQLIANIDIAPTILDIIQQTLSTSTSASATASSSTTTMTTLQSEQESMDGTSIWKYVQGQNDPCLLRRNDILISYNGEGNNACGLADCPPPLDGIWWMPDSFNNTYHCVRTLRFASGNGSSGGSGSGSGNIGINNYNDNEEVGEEENSIYCRFEDDEHFVEFYDLSTNPQQLDNNYYQLQPWQRQRYEKRLKELLDCQGQNCRNEQCTNKK